MPSRRRLAALAGALTAMLAAVSTAGAGWSSPAAAGPQAIASGSLAAPAAPAASITCVQNTSISVGLSWPGAANAAAYDVRRGTSSGGPYTLVGSSAATDYADTAVSQQTTYYYVVVAKRSAWTSAASAQTAVTTPRIASCK